MTKTQSDIIADTIENLIFDGTLKNGERMDEVRLAARFDVSRTPVREALQRLASSGLVEMFPRRGAFVRQPGPVELVEMFEYMAELEASCARFAATRISDAALAELFDVNAICIKSVEAQDSNVYYEQNELFHAVIYQQSQNTYLEEATLRLRRRLRPFRRIQLTLRGRLSQSLSEHENVLKALAEGDGELAARVMREHVIVQGEKFHHIMNSLKQSREAISS